ncbi:MAG: hypothetical protein ACRYG4_27945 [Janthinobacterium lividum]
MAKRQTVYKESKHGERPCLIDRCAASASLTIVAAAALMVPIVAVIDALRG